MFKMGWKDVLTIFDLQVTPILPTKFWVNGLSFQEMFKIDFQDGLLGFAIVTILDFLLTSRRDTSYKVSSQRGLWFLRSL